MFLRLSIVAEKDFFMELNYLISIDYKGSLSGRLPKMGLLLKLFLDLDV